MQEEEPEGGMAHCGWRPSMGRALISFEFYIQYESLAFDLLSTARLVSTAVLLQEEKGALP
ncbi:hypothetical protein D3C78_1732240 [compost metagenome]